MDWEGLHLPEYLWLAAIARDRSISDAALVFNSACDILDNLFRPVEHEVFVGLISDFGFINESDRDQALEALSNHAVASAALSDEFRAMLALYPVGPAAWLARAGNTDLTLNYARSLVDLLRQSKTEKAAQCRILGLNRLLKHDKIRFSPKVIDEETASAISRYPNTGPEGTARVEQLARMAMDMNFRWRSRSGWPLAFWSRNLQLVHCQ